MKLLEPSVLAEMDADSIVRAMCDGDVSVVGSLGCKELLRGTTFGRLGAGLAIWISKLGKHKTNPQALRRSLVKLLKKFTPYETTSPAARFEDSGAVFAFNHPSLGEIPRLICYCSEKHPQKSLLFPVTLVWFEVLAPYYDYLRYIGIEITPTITPKAVEEMQEIAPKMHGFINKIRTKFNSRYLQLTHEFLQKNDIVLLAPNATREIYLFEKEEQIRGDAPIGPETLSLLSISLSKDKTLFYEIIPIAVIPPEMWSTGLNIRDTYILEPCEPICADEAIARAKNKVGEAKVRRLDLDFRKLIAAKLRVFREDLVLRPARIPDVTDPWAYYDEE